MNTTSNTMPAAQSAAPGESRAMRKGVIVGAAGAVLATAVIGASAWLAFQPGSPSEQFNQVGTRTTVIADAPSLPAVPNRSVPESTPSVPAATRAAPPVESAAPAAHRRVAALPGKVGVVSSVREVSVKGEANGVGAVAGGVLGGLLGNQVGGGNGRKVMTVAGAVGGGFAGHEVQKRMNSTKAYQVTVQFDDGTSRTLQESTARGWRNGDRVRVNNGEILPENA